LKKILNLLKAKNENGHSLVEVMVGAGLIGIISLITTQLSTNINKSVKSIEAKSETLIDDTFAIQTLRKDLLLSGPSFNFLQQQASWFTLNNTTRSCTPQNTTTPLFWAIQQADNCDGVQVTLSANNDCFDILTKDDSKFYDTNADETRSRGVFFDTPSSYYKVSAGKPAFDQPSLQAALTHRAIGNIGQLLKINAMSTKVTSLGNQEYGVLFGIIKSTQYSLYSSPTLLVKTPDYSSCTYSKPHSLNKFFRCLPANGSESNIFITPAKYVRYCLKTNPQYKGFELKRMIFSKTSDNGFSFEEKTIARKVKSLFFKRYRTSENVIDTDISFCQIDHATTSGACL